ncbi:MAG: cupredoxin domain-containing protein [Acidiferrobacteraceae bacterium]
MRRAKPVLAATLAAWVSAAYASLPVYQLTGENGRFVPMTLTLPAGQKVKLVVHNRGPAPEEFESTDLNQEQVVVPGASVTLYIGPLQPGRYDFFNDFQSKTVRGHIIVK